MLLDGQPKNIPIYASLQESVAASKTGAFPATHLVIGYAEGEMWGSALLDTTTGAITRLEPWPNAYLSTIWPAQ